MKAIMRDKEELKSSGIEWIGEIPQHWHTENIKYHFDVIAGATPDSKNPEYWDGDITWVTPADYRTEDKYVKCGKRSLSLAGYQACSASLTPKGSIIFSKRAPIGTVALSTTELCTNQGCLACVPKASVNSTYYYYVMSIATEEFELKGAGTTFKEISANNFLNTKLPCLGCEEQQVIANYLDDRCSKIDAIIAEAKASIEEYKELKQAVIYEAVTKGLEKNTELKIVNNHGIDKAPKSWNKIKLGWFCSFHNGDRSNKYPSGNDFQDYGVPFIGADSLNEIYVNIDKCRYITSKKYEDMGGLKIRKDDILYTLRGSTIGKCAITNFDHGTVASSLTGIRVEKTDKLYPMFLLYWLQSQCEYNQRTILINGATAPNLSAENVGQYNLFIPSLDEQMSIAQFLSNVLGKYNSLLYEKQYLIEDLESYKKSLIYEVVTGKRKVVA